MHGVESEGTGRDNCAVGEYEVEIPQSKFPTDPQHNNPALARHK